MEYEEIFKLIVNSTDFNRGFLVGVIDTIKNLYSATINETIAKAIVDIDFGFDDINMLRDNVLEYIESFENNTKKETIDEAD